VNKVDFVNSWLGSIFSQYVLMSYVSIKIEYYIIFNCLCFDSVDVLFFKKW
jgi:hypothetical protein